MTTGRLRISATGLELIKSFEGFRARAARLPDGRWTIGYGHVKAARANLRVSEADAEAILRDYDLPPIERAIARAVHTPLNQNEFDALVSFVFNIGLPAFMKSETLLRLNAGERLAAAEAMAVWRKARLSGRLMVVDALVRRRAVERALFLEPMEGRLAAPSALIRPQADISALVLAPRDKPIELDAAMEGEVAQVRASETGAPIDAGGASAPELAARDVKQRLARVLGDGPSVRVSDEPSVEEITRAISALADAPPPEKAQTPPRRSRVIDDTEQVRVGPEEIARALADHRAFMAEKRRGRIALWAPFALLAGLGAVVALWGVADWAGLLGTSYPPGEREFYAAPFLTVVGVIMFGVMSYYLYRALAEQDDWPPA
ncbi:MAG: lysozyme [Pseudomonadota bacterium]